MHLVTVLQTIVYSLLGVVIFALAFLLMVRVLPFSMRKEIEDDQNTALAIVVGAVILGLAIIVAATIAGG